MISSRRRLHTKKRVWFALLLFIVIMGVIFLPRVPKESLKLPQVLPVHKEEEKPVNILLLGVGGGTHEGPDLTDTIIFAHLDPQNQRVTLASIPRDLWVPDLRAKVNTAYTFGEEKQKDGGLLLSKATIEKIVKQPIDYVVRVDFDGFSRGVDMMGGLDIAVENTFDDYAYPITGKEDDPCGLTSEIIASLSAQIASGSASESESFSCRYEHLHFTKGEQHMDGTTALKYVRSRHAFGIEGSDFARSKRQEKVITAFKQKLFSAGTLLNPAKVVGLFDVLKDSIKTDITPGKYGDIISLLQKLKGAKIKSAIIDTGDNAQERLGLLVNPPTGEEYGGAWVLAPRAGNGDYSEIQEYIACEIKTNNCVVTQNGIVTPTPIPTVTPVPTGKSY